MLYGMLRDSSQDWQKNNGVPVSEFAFERAINIHGVLNSSCA